MSNAVLRLHESSTGKMFTIEPEEEKLQEDLSIKVPTGGGMMVTDKRLITELHKARNIAQPTITYPANEPVDFIETIVASEYATQDSYNGPQTMAIWQASQTVNFETIFAEVQQGVSHSWSPTNLLPLTEFFVRVRYGSAGQLSRWSEPVKFTTPDIFILPPTITYNSDTFGILLSPLLETSDFEVFNGTDEHTSTDWEVVRNSDNVVVFSSIGDTINLTSIQVDIMLDITTEYTLRAKHNGSAYGNSAWQETVVTTTSVAILEPEANVPSAVNETSTTPMNITNYNAENTYSITAALGTIKNQLDSYFEYVAPDVDVDTQETITIVASKDGMDSLPGVFELNIAYVPILADETIQVVNFDSEAIVNTGFTVE